MLVLRHTKKKNASERTVISVGGGDYDDVTVGSFYFVFFLNLISNTLAKLTLLYREN